MTTSITKTLLNQRNEILQEWLGQQLSSQNLRADLISESELRADSDRFLNALSDAVQSGNLSDIQRSEYTPLFSALRKSGQLEAAELVENMLAADLLLDKLGLYTTEVYQLSRETVIRR